jgi:hypothetical protein
MDTKDEIQSSPHSPDPMWRADSPSGDHVSLSNELNISVHISNHDGLSELQLEVSVMGSEWLQQRVTSMNEDGLIDVHSSKPSTSVSPPQLLLPDSVSLSTSQHNPAAIHQPAAKEGDSHSEESREQQPSHPPAPKVKMSLRDFVLLSKGEEAEGRDDEECSRYPIGSRC